MDKNKITAQLLEAGVTEEELGKIDFEKVAEIIEIPKEDALEILNELDFVDKFIYQGMYSGDDYTAEWYRR